MITQKQICLKLDKETNDYINKYMELSGHKNRNRIINMAIQEYCEDHITFIKMRQLTLSFN